MSKLLTNMLMAVSETVSTMSEQVDTMEQRVNGMVEDMRDLKTSSLEQRDRVSRLEGEFNADRSPDIQFNSHTKVEGSANIAQGQHVNQDNDNE